MVQRNLHGLVASLAANFERPSQMGLLDEICLKIKESWAIASHRERSLLVDLIGKIVERGGRSDHLDQVIIPKVKKVGQRTSSHFFDFLGLFIFSKN